MSITFHLRPIIPSLTNPPEKKSISTTYTRLIACLERRINLAFILARATILQPLKYKFTKRTNQSCRALPVTIATVAVADPFEFVTPHQFAPGVFQICIILQLLISLSL